MQHIYVTGAWQQGIGGGFTDFFDQVRLAGYEPYDWTTAEHKAANVAEQSRLIMEHIKKSAALVFVLDTSRDHDYGATQKQLGMALVLDKPIFVVDALNGGHEGTTRGMHKVLDNIHCKGALETLQLCIVPSAAEVIAKLRGME